MVRSKVDPIWAGMPRPLNRLRISYGTAAEGANSAKLFARCAYAQSVFTHNLIA